MAEVPAVVEWNRGPLGPLAGHPLNDKRVRVDMGVGVTLGSSRGRFDVVLLDVGNGPAALPRRTMRGFTTTVDWPQLVRLSRPAECWRFGLPGRIENSSSACAMWDSPSRWSACVA